MTLTWDRWRLRLVLLAIFVFGAASGGAVAQLYTTAKLRELLGGPPETLEARVKLLMLDRGLSLSSVQRARLRPLLEESSVRMRAARARVEPELALIRESERRAVAAELTAEQRREYERRLKDIDRALGRGQ
jgi:hypothetical protein